MENKKNSFNKLQSKKNNLGKFLIFIFFSQNTIRLQEILKIESLDKRLRIKAR